LVTTAN